MTHVSLLRDDSLLFCLDTFDKLNTRLTATNIYDDSNNKIFCNLILIEYRLIFKFLICLFRIKIFFTVIVSSLHYAFALYLTIIANTLRESFKKRTKNTW